MMSLYFTTLGQPSDSDGGSVKGIFIDEEGAPVVYANLTLIPETDSTAVQYTSTDPAGNFWFQNLSYGAYHIKAESIGYQTTTTAAFQIQSSTPSVDLDTITMSLDANQLSEVRITSIRPSIEHVPGQTNINLENSSFSTGNSLMEVLQKSPGVFVDQNGQISLNGKSGVQIMIDGQDSHLNADQLASFLESTPAESISKIELMNNPSEKYTAAGTAGIINIVMKKNKTKGIKGSVQTGLGYGQYWRTNNSLNLSYNSEKLSLYADYSYRHNKTKNINEIHRYFMDSITDRTQHSMYQNSEVFRNSNTHSTRFGLDYKIKDNQSIGVDLKAGFSDTQFTTYSPIDFKSASNQIDSVSLSKNHIGSKWNNQSANLHYKLDFDKESGIAVNLDYNRFHDRLPQSLKTTLRDPEENILSSIERRGIQPSTIQIYAAKTDYTQNLGNDYLLETGLKTSFVKSDNNSIFEIKKDQQWQDDPGNTNHFIYNENVNAAYFSLHKEFDKGWSVKAGLRAEQVNIKTVQRTTDSINRQHYADLFPNVSISKAFNENHKLNFSYSRRINRPDYQNLNPFIFYIDEYSYEQGNPFLKPEYIDKFALTYIFKNQYSAEISYDRTHDIMTQIIDQKEPSKAIFQTTENINSSDNISLNLNAPVSLTKWWDTYNSARIFYNRYTGLYNGFPLDKNMISLSLNSQQTFILPGNLKAELNAMYRSKTIMGAFEIKDVATLSLGLQKSLWDDRASLKLNVNDVFQTLNFGTDVHLENMNFTNRYRSFSRSASLTFTWNFGNQNIKTKRHQDSSLEEEERRIEKAD